MYGKLSRYFDITNPRTLTASIFFQSLRGRGKTPNTERRMQNAVRRMHCLLAVSFTCVCLRLAFICWKGPNTIKCCPFQQIKANRKQTQVKLTASKQCIRRSAFYPCRSLRPCIEVFSFPYILLFRRQRIPFVIYQGPG